MLNFIHNLTNSSWFTGIFIFFYNLLNSKVFTAVIIVLILTILRFIMIKIVWRNVDSLKTRYFISKIIHTKWKRNI